MQFVERTNSDVKHRWQNKRRPYRFDAELQAIQFHGEMHSSSAICRILGVFVFVRH